MTAGAPACNIRAVASWITCVVFVEISLAALCIAVSVALRPWRMLAGPLGAPWAASLVVLSLLWVLPQMLPSGISIQLSGACLLVLMFGWPLAVLELLMIALAVWALGSVGWQGVLAQLVWAGLVPAGFALGLGEVLRRRLPAHPFVYVLGRAFIGTALCVFVAGTLFELTHTLLGGASLEHALVARWLMAWGDAFLTGMLVAVFVAFVPEWLATWSDSRYLGDPPKR
jgi:uncharacterized membrane protein